MDAWDNRTSPSVDADETETSEMNATPPPANENVRSVLSYTPSKFFSAGTEVLGKRKIGEMEASDSYNPAKNVSATGSSIFLNAVTLLQRLVKGKSILRDEVGGAQS